MNLICTALLLLCVGCAVAPARQMATMTRAAMGAASPAPEILWVWNPGGYSNFVMVTSTDLSVPLAQWETLVVTTDTNVWVAKDAPQRFYALYGTNLITGDSAWCVKTNP